jgi:TPR repeat protein
MSSSIEREECAAKYNEKEKPRKAIFRRARPSENEVTVRAEPVYPARTMKSLRLPLLLITSALVLASCGTVVMTRADLEAKAKAGDASAQFELGAVYHDGTGEEKDFKKAIEWFTKAANQGDVRAQFNIGVMYYMGESVKQDFDIARGWFEKAAAKNNARAEFNLGVMYYRGEGVKQDFKKAMEYFTQAALQNFNEAQFNLGVMYAKGEGIEVDMGRAYAWFSVAKDNGNPRAEEVLKSIERGLKPEDTKIVQQLTEDLRAELKKRNTQ